MTTETQKETEKKTRNLGDICVQAMEEPGRWVDISLGGPTGVTGVYDNIQDASGDITEHGKPGKVYRVVRTYPAVRVTETKKRSLEPA